MRLQLKVWPLSVVDVIGIDLPLASRLAPAASVPASTALLTSVRSACASLTAPAMFNSPAPCCNRLAPATGWALYCRMALMSGGVRPGLACNISATAPDTTGAATEVPDSIITDSPPLVLLPTPCASCGYLAGSALRKNKVKLSTDLAPRTLLPGATRSGLSRLSTRRAPWVSMNEPRVGPRELKKLTLSSLRTALPRVLTAPTVITEGSWPGELMAP